MTTEAKQELKYAVHPGYVISKRDRYWHWIGFSQLCKLYKVPPRICVDMSQPRNYHGWPKDKKWIHLYPSYSGNYSLPE